MKHLAVCGLFTFYLVWLYWGSYKIIKKLRTCAVPWYFYLFPVVPSLILTVCVAFVYWVEYLKYTGGV